MTYLHIMRDIRREMDAQKSVPDGGNFFHNAIRGLGALADAVEGRDQAWQLDELVYLAALCVNRLEGMDK